MAPGRHQNVGGCGVPTIPSDASSCKKAVTAAASTSAHPTSWWLSVRPHPSQGFRTPAGPPLPATSFSFSGLKRDLWPYFLCEKTSQEPFAMFLSIWSIFYLDPLWHLLSVQNRPPALHVNSQRPTKPDPGFCNELDQVRAWCLWCQAGLASLTDV